MHHFSACAAGLSRVSRRFVQIFAEFFRENRAILHEVLRKIGAPRTRNACKTCAQSSAGPGRVCLSITVILMIGRCVARRKRARFFSENRADFNEILPDFRVEHAHMARKICAKAPALLQRS